MPELAEVAFYRRRWDTGLGKRVRSVELHAGKRIFRGTDTAALSAGLSGATLRESLQHGKQMAFRFSGGRWLGIHLGMTGKFRTDVPEHIASGREHLILRQARQALVFEDFRLFGRVLYHEGKAEPDWWQGLPPEILSEAFTIDRVREFLIRRKGSPIKSVLLMQDGFPGIGNWMADEICWQAQIDPHTKAGAIADSRRHLRKLYSKTRDVSRTAMETIAVDWSDPPRAWLFRHRWKDGHTCPRTGKPIQRDLIGRRRTAWVPGYQQPLSR
jgi:formamidopyrimidine-DNA glycosylase